MLLVNGRRQGEISAADRAFNYGDGLFETIAVVDSVPRLWDLHLQRLQRGAHRLGLPVPDAGLLAAEARALCAGAGDGVLKLIWSAGPGGRGYARGALEPTRVLRLGPLPDYPASHWRDGVAVRWCQLRLAEQPRLAGIKHLNRLEQVLARAEWVDQSVAEGLMLAHNGCVIEGTMSNLFVVRDGCLLTPALTVAGVEGVMRQRVLDLAAAAGLGAEVVDLRPQDVTAADEVFLTNSIIGIWPVARIERQRIAVGAVSRRLQEELLAAGDVSTWL